MRLTNDRLEKIDTRKEKNIKILFTFIILFISITFLAGCSDLSSNSSDFYETAKVTKVVDGDTINVQINGKDYKVRMIGVDTPETVHPSKPVQFYGREASDYTKKNLTDKTVYLQKDVSDTDKYGRLLRYVWTAAPSSDNPSEEEIIESMYNANLVKNGYAHAYTYQPNSRYSDLFSKLQSSAREKNIGLWNPDLEKKFNNGNSGEKNISTNSKKSSDATSNKIKGNKKSKIYHLPGSKTYSQVSEKNAVYFDTEQDAIDAGYKKSGN
ncbi:thermonuclease family protein [Peptostreptococcus porci]|uniref:thermonuclease family protein n=1 Tax=Peptostreptococcus porci TaxID=2652282 RepID=UPI002A74CEA4|nr:thermonuclease family protein [Peptostreptococcus porci]MDY2794767.1 thermonuclease family protein [Peptostreptococcus porci]